MKGKSVKPLLRDKDCEKASLVITNKQTNTQKTKKQRVPRQNHSPFLSRICLILQFSFFLIRIVGDGVQLGPLGTSTRLEPNCCE
jgi:hypothetical protein